MDIIVKDRGQKYNNAIKKAFDLAEIDRIVTVIGNIAFNRYRKIGEDMKTPGKYIGLKKIMGTELKLVGRKIRIFRLLVIVQVYSAYRMMNLDREAMSIENNWLEAERMQQSIKAIFPYSDASVESFIYDKQKLADEALLYYDKFKYWMHIAESLCITETTLRAFCKNVEGGSSVYWLKCLGHLYYGDWLTSLYLYLDGKMMKEELFASLVEYSLFTGKSKPANMAHFRKDMVEIEKVINEIHYKQLNRRINCSQNKSNIS